MVIRREEGWLGLFWAGMGRVEKWSYLWFRMLPRPSARGVSQDFFVVCILSRPGTVIQP